MPPHRVEAVVLVTLALGRGFSYHICFTIAEL